MKLTTRTTTREGASHLFRLGYRPALDGLRGVAVLIVMIFHMIPSLLPGGFLGVDIFFVLSGFLITSLLYQEWQATGAISLRNFYARRALRLLPALLLLLLVVTPFVGWTWTAITLSYVANWFMALGKVQWQGMLDHVWTLSVEEQFYLLWPLALLTMLRRGWSFRRIVLVIVLAISASSLRMVELYDKVGWQRVWFASDSRAHELLIGCVAALLVFRYHAGWNEFVRRMHRAVSAIAMVTLAACVILIHPETPFLFSLGGLTVIATCIAVLVTMIVLYPIRIVLMTLQFPPLVEVGKVSYSLYLWHHVFTWIIPSWQLPLSAQLSLELLLSFSVAFGSYYAVERRMLKLKTRFPPEIRSQRAVIAQESSPHMKLGSGDGR